MSSSSVRPAIALNAALASMTWPSSVMSAMPSGERSNAARNRVSASTCASSAVFCSVTSRAMMIRPRTVGLSIWFSAVQSNQR